jgi:hypothetical protein
LVLKNFILEVKMKNSLKRGLLILICAILGLLVLNSCNFGKKNTPVTSDVPDAWWADFARFTNNGTVDGAKSVDADAITAFGGFHDEGVGAYARETWSFYEAKPQIDLAKASKIKGLAWLEFSGQTRVVIGAVHNLGNGKYEMDEKLGVPKMISTFWSWDYNGNGVNSNANQIVWYGAHSWANKEPWNGKYIMPSDFPEPKYPDGTSALGLLKPGSIDPRDYKFYDALAGKSIFGTLVDQDGFSTNKNTNGYIKETHLDGTQGLTGDYSFCRDIASDWWIEYNRQAVQGLLKTGANGFWVDNYTGWDFMGANPLINAFGDWSVQGFKDYLKKYPISGIKADSFDIRAYLINKAKSENAQMDTTKFTNDTASIFQNIEWLDDPVWKSYLAYKSEVVSTQEKKFYDMIKQEAKNIGLNPNDILVSGNDVALLQNGSMISGNQLDMVSAEYGPDFSAVTGSYSDKTPLQGYAGPLYKLTTQLSKSKRGSIWYYLPDNLKDNVNLAKMLSFEALADNCVINSGDGIPTTPGTNASAKFVNDVIGGIRNDFGKREIKASVALYNSGNSEYSQLTPGGYIEGGNVQSTLAYYGWGSTLENLKIPYQTITEQGISQKALENIDVLIMANINSVSQATVNNILKPFLDQGKTIIVTGQNAGAEGLRDTQFKTYEKPILVDLAKTFKGKGKVVYISSDPTVDAYKDKSNVNLFNTCKVAVTKIFSGLSDDKKYTKDLTLSGFNDETLVSLNQDQSNSKFYVDLVNRNIDIDSDVMKTKQSGKITVKVPDWVNTNDLKVNIYLVNSNTVKLAPIQKTVKASNGYITLDIPSFDYYASVVVSTK